MSSNKSILDLIDDDMLFLLSFAFTFLSLMLTENEKRLIWFKQALRMYQNCKPTCLQTTKEVDDRVTCFEQCSKKQKYLVDRLKITLQYNIE